MSKKYNKTFSPSEYYCHSCSINIFDFYPNIEHSSFSGSSYQSKKFIKHTEPNNNNKDYCSLFYEKEQYYSLINLVIASGSIEVRNGKHNIVYIHNQPVGYALKNGSLVDDKLYLVKMVKFNNPETGHPFCSGSAGAINASCKACGQKVFDYVIPQTHNL